MNILKIINVSDENIGKRIDTYLAANTEHSRANVQRLIENEKILVNGKKTKVSYKVQPNDEIRKDTCLLQPCGRTCAQRVSPVTCAGGGLQSSQEVRGGWNQGRRQYLLQ